VVDIAIPARAADIHMSVWLDLTNSRSRKAIAVVVKLTTSIVRGRINADRGTPIRRPAKLKPKYREISNVASLTDQSRALMTNVKRKEPGTISTLSSTKQNKNRKHSKATNT